MRWHHFCAFGLFCGFVISSAARAEPLYHVTDLGALPSQYNESRARALNNSAQVTGTSHADGTIYSHGFFWSSATSMVDLADFGGGNDESLGQDINDLGHIVGSGSVAKENGSDSGIRALLWTRGGGLQNLGKPAGSDGAAANAINSSDQVVGHSFTSSGVTHRAFLWSSGDGFTDLGDMPNGMNYVFANDINDSTVVVGSSQSPGNSRAFRWTSAGGMQKLADLSSVLPDTYAVAINNQNWIVGESHDGAKYRAVLWNPSGGIMDLGALPGGIEESGANSINNLMQVVGVSNIGTDENESFRAILWTIGDGVRDLNNLLDVTGAGWSLNRADDINDSGQIVGTGVYCQTLSSCVEHAYLLTPIPEPATSLLWAAITLIVPLRRRRVR